MAQSRIQPLDLASLIAATKNTGPADAINAGVQGVTQGMSLANSMAMKRMEQQKMLSDQAMKMVDEARKIRDEQRQEANNSANRVPVQAPGVASTAKVNSSILPAGINAPTDDSGSASIPVKPYDTTVTKMVTPEAANALNPDPLKQFGKELSAKVASGALSKEDAARQFESLKVPETMTPLAFNPSSHEIITKGSKTDTANRVQLGNGDIPLAGYGAELRMEPFKDRNAITSAKNIRDALVPSEMKDPAAKLTYGKVMAAQRFEPLLAQMMSQPGGGDRRQMLEVARQLDTMLTTGGMPSEKITESFMPQTLKGKVRSFQEFVTNVPTGVDAQDFLQRTADTFHRESDTAKSQLHNFQKERIAGLRTDARIAPDVWQSVLRDQGFDPNNIDENGVYKEPQNPTPQHPAVHSAALDWANKMLAANPNDPKAIAVKQKALKELGQ